MWTEGFDTWATFQDGLGKGWNFPNGKSLVSGRFGGQALNVQGASIVKSLASAVGTLYVGFAANLTSANWGGTGNFGVYNNGTNVASIVFSGTNMYVTDSSNGSTAVTLFNQFATYNAWSYLEAQFVANPTLGTVVLRQDGSVIGSLNVPLASSFGAVWFGGWSGNFSTTALVIDDVYVNDTQSSINPGFCGPLAVITLNPDADTGNATMTPNSGTVLYSQVNASIENGGSTFIQATDPNQYAQFTFNAMPSLLGQIVCATVQHTSINISGSNTVSTVMVSGGVTVASSYQSLVGSAYECFGPACVEYDPATGSAWATTAINSIIAGITNGNP